MDNLNPAEIHPDDIRLYHALSHLQSMHSTLRKTRRAPTGVISPLRQAARSQQQSPSVLAARISKAASQGRQDIIALKAAWSNEVFRKYNKLANEADLEQGIDSWEWDYVTLATELRKLEAEKVVEMDSVDEMNAAVEEFQKGKTKGVLKRDAENLELEVGMIKFEIERGESEYQVKASSKNDFVRSGKIVEFLGRTSVVKRMDRLLEVLEAFHDIGRHQCEGCKNLFDDDLGFTTIRKERQGEDGRKYWFAYHEGCEPS